MHSVGRSSCCACFACRTQLALLDAWQARLSSADAEEQLANAMEREREKRVAHVQQIAARRIGKMGLARGWSGWHEQWAEKRRRRNLLRAAGARLLRPKLSATFSEWRQDWSEMVRAAAEARQRRALASSTGKAAAEATQLQTELRSALQASQEEVARLRRELTRAQGDAGASTAEL